MATTISVDLKLCAGYACCMMEAPSLFDIDDATDKAVVLLAAVPPADLPLAQAAERACPARAITLSSDDVTGA